MTSISNNVYNDELNNRVDKYKNTGHRTIKMKRIHVKASKDVKLKVGDNVRKLKNKNVFAKGYRPNSSKEVFVFLQKVKNAVPWIYIISDLNGDEIVEMFKTIQTEFKIKKH